VSFPLPASTCPHLSLKRCSHRLPQALETLGDSTQCRLLPVILTQTTTTTTTAPTTPFLSLCQSQVREDNPCEPGDRPPTAPHTRASKGTVPGTRAASRAAAGRARAPATPTDTHVSPALKKEGRFLTCIFCVQGFLRRKLSPQITDSSRSPAPGARRTTADLKQHTAGQSP